MNQRLEFLREVPLFRALPDRSLDIIAGLVTEECHDAGAELIREGDDADRLYILIDGVVVVVKGYGQENSTALGFEGPISTFGEIGLVDGGPRSATVLCVERCRFLSLDHDAFQILLQHNIDICRLLLIEICQRLREADEVLALC
jgi:CRP/FNR family transcriptional regulator, cyclic AMP receptor protein